MPLQYPRIQYALIDGKIEERKIEKIADENPAVWKETYAGLVPVTPPPGPPPPPPPPDEEDDEAKVQLDAILAETNAPAIEEEDPEDAAERKLVEAAGITVTGPGLKEEEKGIALLQALDPDAVPIGGTPESRKAAKEARKAAKAGELAAKEAAKLAKTLESK